VPEPRRELEERVRVSLCSRGPGKNGPQTATDDGGGGLGGDEGRERVIARSESFVFQVRALIVFRDETHTSTSRRQRYHARRKPYVGFPY